MGLLNTERKATFLFGRGVGFKGQQITSELIISGLRQRGWRVQTINTPLLDRITETSSFKRVITKIWLGLGILVAWSKGLWAVFRPGMIHLNLGQTKFALIRDGLPVFIKSFFTHNGSVIISLHGNLFMAWHYDSFEARILRQLSKISHSITVSGPSQKAQLVELGISELKVMAVDNTCSLFPLSQPECVRKQVIAQGQPLEILYLSSLIETKGYPEFVQAIEYLTTKTEFPIKATLCGKIVVMDTDSQFITRRAAQKWIEAKIAKINQSQNVRLHWVKGVTGGPKEELYHKTHIFILPSRYEVESQPIAVLEALSSGCAVITSKVGEIPTTVSSQTAWLLDTTTPETIAEAILTLQSNSNKRQQLALAGLKLYKERFDYTNHIDRWEKLLLEIGMV